MTTNLTLDETRLTALKETLLKRRSDILAASTGTRPLPESADVNSRQGDLANRGEAMSNRRRHPSGQYRERVTRPVISPCKNLQ